jgi:hypothetical protein
MVPILRTDARDSALTPSRGTIRANTTRRCEPARRLMALVAVLAIQIVLSHGAAANTIEGTIKNLNKYSEARFGSRRPIRLLILQFSKQK